LGEIEEMRQLVLGVAGAIALSASANAADIYVPPVSGPVSYKDEIPVATWTGFYIGVQGGGAWGNSVQTFNAGGTTGSTARFDISGGEGGGTLGYNWQMRQWVFGVETDYSGSDIEGSTGSTLTYGCGSRCATNVTSFGTLRGRVGYAWDNVLVYGTGGLAYGDIKSSLNGGTVSNWQDGWTAGVGAEYKFTPNWSAKLEWIHVEFDSFQWTNATNTHYSCTGINCSTDAKFDVVRAGLNYRFGSVYEPLK
jgi:outer membrane immunogenic protein